MINSITDGNVITWTNSTGSAVSSGDLVMVGSMPGVAAVDIANTAEGAVALAGVYELTATNAAAITLGAPVYRDASTGKITPTAEDNVFVGMAWTAKAETATTVQVRLGGYHPTVNESA